MSTVHSPFHSLPILTLLFIYQQGLILLIDSLLFNKLVQCSAGTRTRGHRIEVADGSTRLSLVVIRLTH